MIRVRKAAEPASLAEARSEMEKMLVEASANSWTIELAKDATKLTFTKDENKKILKINMSDEAYRPPEAKARLVLDHYGKCAFCESRFYSTAVGDVEHYRPKGGYNEFDRNTPSGLSKRSGQGYFWLAYNWNNHLLSCKMCNSEFKGNIAFLMPDMLDPDEAKLTERLSWDSPAAQTESLVLLNPADPNDPDPRAEISFDPTSGLAIGGVLDDKGRFISVSHRGGATIQYMGLNRPDLVFARANHLLLLRSVFVEMTRSYQAVLMFLVWQRGKDWHEEAARAISVATVWGSPDISGLSDKRREKERNRLLSMRKVLTDTQPLPSYPDVVMSDSDPAVPSHVIAPTSTEPLFSCKDKVDIPDSPCIDNNPQTSPLQYLRYAVSPRAAFSGLARDALAAWSLELAQAMLAKSSFAVQLDKPQTNATAPVRSTADMRPFSIHAHIWNWYTRDMKALRQYEQDWTIKHACWAAKVDMRSLEFVCRKILLLRIDNQHTKLGTMCNTQRASSDYSRLYYEHLQDLDEIERTMVLYKIDAAKWKDALRDMNENMDNHPPAIDYRLNFVIKRFNTLVDNWHQRHLPAYQQEWLGVSQEVDQLTDDYMRVGGSAEAEVGKLQLMRNGLDASPPAPLFDLQPGTLQSSQDSMQGIVLPTPPAKVDAIEVDPPEQSTWKKVTASAIQSKTDYLGKDREEVIWQQIRADAVVPSRS
ncbi:MAG: hypothetical protein QM742_03980 [Aquabacterium sp.]